MTQHSILNKLHRVCQKQDKVQFVLDSMCTNLNEFELNICTVSWLFCLCNLGDP